MWIVVKHQGDIKLGEKMLFPAISRADKNCIRKGETRMLE